MITWGDIPLGSVIPFPFAAFGTDGQSLTLTGLATTDIEVYKGTSMTERASDAGYALLDTDGIDIDTRTGIHGFSIDTGDNTDAGFYVAGALFYVVVDAVTINAQTVRFVAGTFRLTAAESVAGVPEVDVTHADGTSGAGNALADALLKRDWTSVTGEASRSVLNALRHIRNKWGIAAGTKTVYKEDGTTPAWTSTPDTDASSDPIIGDTPS